MGNKVRTTLIAVVSVVWALNFSAPVFVKGYVPPEGVHIAFMAIVGILTAGYEKDSQRKGDHDGEDHK